MARPFTWFRSSLDRFLGKNTPSANSPNGRPAQHTRARRVPCVEALEDRILMSVTPTISWTGAGGDLLWTNPLNWDANRLPNANDDVAILTNDPRFEVYLNNSGGTTVHSLFAQGRLDLNDRLTLSDASEIDGGLDMEGGTLTAATDLVLAGRGGFSGTVAGTFHLTAGNYALSSARLSGQFDLDQQSTLALASYASGTLADGFRVTGAGLLQMGYASSVTFAGGATVSNLELDSNCFVYGSGTLHVTGTMNWIGGGLFGPGTTVIDAGAVLNLIGRDLNTSYRLDSGHTLRNAGTVNWFSGGLIVYSGDCRFENLPNAVVQVTSNAALQNWYPESGTLTFRNQGIFRQTGAAFTALGNVILQNDGLIDVQTGDLDMGGDLTIGGTVTVAAGAALQIGGGTATFTADSSVTGQGAVQFLAGTSTIQGGYNVTRTDISPLTSYGATAAFAATTAAATTAAATLGAFGTLTGQGTLTVTQSLSWTGGVMSGNGTTVIAPGAFLNLPTIPGQSRVLFGRFLQNWGRTLAYGESGLITLFYPDAQGQASGSENYFNDQAPLDLGSGGVTTRPFDPQADAGTLYRAMFGGLTGWGTNEEAIYAVFAGRTVEQVQAIRAAYQGHYGTGPVPDDVTQSQLDKDLASEFSDDEKLRVDNLLAGDRALADAAGLHYAMNSWGSFRIGTNVLKVLEDASRASGAAIKAAYQQQYHSDLPTDLRDSYERSLLTFIEGQFKRALALLSDNPAQAAAGQIFEALSRIWNDPQEPIRLLRNKSAADVQQIAAAYQTNYFESLSAAVMRSVSNQRYRQALQFYLQGDSIRGDAARLRGAMEGAGTDEQVVWETLDGTTSDRRAMIAQVYKPLFGSTLWADIQDDFGDTLLFGEQLAKTSQLLYHGGQSDIQKLHYAIYGLGTDEKLLFAVLEKNDKDGTMEQLKAAYQNAYGVSLYDDNYWDTSGRDWGNARRLLTIDASTPDGQLKRFIDAYTSEVFGRTWGVFQYDEPTLLSALGYTTDRQRSMSSAAALKAFCDPYLDASGTLQLPPDQVAQFNVLLARAQQDLKTDQDTTDATADFVGNVAATAAGLAVVVLSGGAGSPLAYTLLALRAGLGAGTAQVLGKALIAGPTYSIESIPSDFATGVINGAAAPFLAGLIGSGGTASQGLARLFQAAVREALIGAGAGGVGGVAAATFHDGTWDDGLVHGALRVIQGGVVGSLTGFVAGTLIGFASETFQLGLSAYAAKSVVPVTADAAAGTAAAEFVAGTRGQSVKALSLVGKTAAQLDGELAGQGGWATAAEGRTVSADGKWVKTVETIPPADGAGAPTVRTTYENADGGVVRVEAGTETTATLVVKKDVSAPFTPDNTAFNVKEGKGLTLGNPEAIITLAATDPASAVPRATVLGVPESSDVITLWKAPQAGRAGSATEVVDGFDPAQYPGEGAFFATDRRIAEEFLRSYQNGLQEINIPRSTFDRLVYEGVIEVDGLYQAGRSWHVRPDRMAEFNEAVIASATENRYHP